MSFYFPDGKGGKIALDSDSDISVFNQAEMNYIFPNPTPAGEFPQGISVFTQSEMNYIFQNPPSGGEFPQGISAFTNQELNYIFA